MVSQERDPVIVEAHPNSPPSIGKGPASTDDKNSSKDGKMSDRKVLKRSGTCGSSEDGGGVCRMDSMGIAGPGWFTNVFDLSVEFDSNMRVEDSPSLSIVPPTSYRRWVPLLNATSPISGTVTLHAPPGRAVWTHGIKIAVEEHLVLLESAGSELLCSAVIDVAKGQYIEESKSFTFRIPVDTLERGGGMTGLRESYIGDMLALRHQIVVSAQRPWYTFNVVSQVPIFVQRISIPRSVPNRVLGPSNEEGGPNTVIIIPDCNGRAEFSFDRDSLDLDDVLEGTATYTDLTIPISGAHIVIIRTETIGGNMFESVVGEHTFLGSSPPGDELHRPQLPPHALENGSDGLIPDEFIASPYVEFRNPEVYTSKEQNCPTDPITGSGTLKAKFSFSKMPLSPTMPFLGPDLCADSAHEQDDENDDIVGVRYFMRFILEEMPMEENIVAPAYWNTHEIFFHRSRIQPHRTATDGDYDAEQGYAEIRNIVALPQQVKVRDTKMREAARISIV